MNNPFEKGPQRNIERTITCPSCNNREPEKSNCSRCKGKGSIVDKS